MSFFVKEIEHDDWSGPDILSIKEYDTKIEAEKAAAKINRLNTLPSAPSYYITAEVVNDISLSEANRYLKQ